MELPHGHGNEQLLSLPTGASVHRYWTIHAASSLLAALQEPRMRRLRRSEGMLLGCPEYPGVRRLTDFSNSRVHLLPFQQLRHPLRSSLLLRSRRLPDADELPVRGASGELPVQSRLPAASLRVRYISVHKAVRGKLLLPCVVGPSQAPWSFQIPTLSNYYHDVMPYFFCCKWVSDHCQFFYWRRPSSGCQNYRPPGIATIMGAGHFITFDNLQYTFNEPGTYVFLHKPEVKMQYQYNREYYNPNIQPSPQCLIEIRMERFPNRMTDFSEY